MPESSKIELRIDRHPCERNSKVVYWKKCLPFAVNPRGILTHRVRSVTTFFSRDGTFHHGTHYWCNNQTCADVTFHADPPADRLLCARCEAAAASAGQKSSDELAGHHVHIGELRAKRLCCTSEAN